MAALTRENVLSLLNRFRPELRKLGIRKLALFGSAARDEVQPESDIDLLVEFEPPVTFDRYIHAKFYLEELLGRPVDLVFPETLKERTRPSIESERIDVT
jgi:uncharacterized protein